MNNFKYYNDSLAYDFDLFMPRPEKAPKAEIIRMEKANEQRTPAARKRKSAAKKRVSLSVVSVLVCAFFLAALCAGIFIRIRINEVNTQINSLNTEINKLDAEYTKLYVDMEKIVSYNNLETAAAALGMKKMDKEQVVYIKVNDKNTAITAAGEKVVSDEQ